MIIAGNFYPMRVQLGPLDAGIGMVLKGNGKGSFEPMPYTQTGLYLPGDVRRLVSIKGVNRSLFAVAKNNGPLQVVELVQ